MTFSTTRLLNNTSSSAINNSLMSITPRSFVHAIHYVEVHPHIHGPSHFSGSSASSMYGHIGRAFDELAGCECQNTSFRLLQNFFNLCNLGRFEQSEDCFFLGGRSNSQ